MGGWPGNVADPLMIGSLIVPGIGLGFVQSASMTAVSFTLTVEIKGIALGIFNMLTHSWGEPSAFRRLSGELCPDGGSGIFLVWAWLADPLRIKNGRVT